MASKRATSIVIWLGISGGLPFLLTPAGATAPQFTVAAAQWAFNAHSQNWICDAQSDINPDPLTPPNCYGSYPPASYTFMHHVYYTEIQPSGQYVALVDGGARDGGFESRAGDTSSTFLLQGPQGGTHTLRETAIQYAPLASLHWEPDSTLWDTDLNALEVFETVFTTGHIPSAPDNYLYVGQSLDGVSNFNWNRIFYSSRPGGQGTGSQHVFNKAFFDQDPTHPFRWIGLISWSFNDGTSNTSGTTPIYIDYNRQVFGIQFENNGWCEFPWGHEWNGFTTGAACNPASSTIPDNFYALPGLGSSGKNSQDLQIIDGKPLILQMWRAEQHCQDSDNDCINVHAPCPSPTVEDLDLYRTRRNEKEWDFGNEWSVREIDFSTWDETSPGHQFNGAGKTILDDLQENSPQNPQFHINPSDVGISATSYHGGSIRQYSDGRVYLYLSIKHSLCLPEANPELESWYRFPKKTSGASLMWLRLSY